MSDKVKTTILNVDDDYASRYAVSRILRQAGFEVMEAANGEETLRLVRANPDLVILDVNLPDIDGFEVCRRIKADPATSLIPVLNLSATYLDDQFRVKGLESGADGYLTEPVEPPVLIAYVKALLRTRQAQEAVRESEQRYRQLFEGVGDAVMVYGSEGRFLDCNETTLRRYGYSREELLRLRAADIVHPGFHQLMKDNQERIWAGESTVVESVHRCKDGRVIPVEVSARRIEYQGEPAILAVVRDITERKRAEEAARQAQQRYVDLANNLNVGVYRNSAEGRILEANSALVAMTEADSREELLKHNVTDFYKYPTRRKELVDKLMEFGFVKNEEVLFVSFKGREIWTSVSAVMENDEEGNAYIEGILQDITERKRAEEMKDNLIRDVSHELKTPLAKMQMSVEKLMETVGAPSIDRQEMAKVSEIVAGNVQRLQHTVNNILDLSSLESGRIPYHMTRVQPKNLIGQVILDMQLLAETKGLELVAKLPESLPQVKGDQEKLLRVLTNLVDNAVKFTDRGKIVISAEKKAHEVEIAVSDSGRGILRKNLNRAFERFWQERPSIPGAGVGLAICKTIVEAHGGKIWAESDGRGQGTTIRFTLLM